MTYLYGQTSECKVLKPEISGTYVGSCKQGLASGEGEATGIDFYKGEFVKGLPHGKGTYIWKNGATYTGDWKRMEKEPIHMKPVKETLYLQASGKMINTWEKY